jgi:ketosteroid isomerase-like protein
MSANLDLVRSLYAGFERGDWFSLAHLVHPDVELVIADGPSPGRWKGVVSAGEVWQDFLSTWEDPRAVAEGYRELDDERVLVLEHYSGRGMTSGVEIGQTRTQGATLWHVRDGRVTRAVVYWDRERALADLGLASEHEAP